MNGSRAHLLVPNSDKASLRKQIIALRDSLDAAERRAASARITFRLLTLRPYLDAHCVMAYASFGAEFDTAAFIADLRSRGKALVLPRVDRATRSLKLHSIRNPEAELGRGVMGISEPRADLCPEVAPAAVDFVLVPGVAFTERCDRLGYGGGFYDRLIRGFEKRPALIAAAFSVQVVSELPVTPADQHVDRVVTESAEYVHPSA